MALHHPVSNHNNAAEFQVSGIPYVTSSAANEATTAPIRINFPYVTRWIEVVNTEAAGQQDLRVGFSENGVNTNPNANYLVVPSGRSSGRLELKCDHIFIRSASGNGTFSVAAGLTTVPPSNFLTLSGSATPIIEGVG
jgi:hypothetical protein